MTKDPIRLDLTVQPDFEPDLHGFLEKMFQGVSRNRRSRLLKSFLLKAFLQLEGRSPSQAGDMGLPAGTPALDAAVKETGSTPSGAATEAKTDINKAQAGGDQPPPMSVLMQQMDEVEVSFSY